MPRTSKKIDPVAIAAIALKKVKTKTDYSRITAANTPADIEAALKSLAVEDQQRIATICKDSPQPDINAIADEILNCVTCFELRSIKAEYGESLIKQAWLTIPIPDRDRIKALCENGKNSEEAPPLTEQPFGTGFGIAQPEAQGPPAPYQVEQHPQLKPRTLFSISDDLEKLNDLLDDCGNDAEQQELIGQWFEQLGDERDRKLDGYAALVSEMSARAEVRKAEAKRLTELAAADENRARLLKDRLKWFFQIHNLKSLDTARYRLSLAKNGGKAPLILDDSVPVTRIPEQFQRVSIDPDTTAIREALERGEKLDFAQLGERGTSLRIR